MSVFCFTELLTTFNNAFTLKGLRTGRKGEDGGGRAGEGDGTYLLTLVACSFRLFEFWRVTQQVGVELQVHVILLLQFSQQFELIQRK